MMAVEALAAVGASVAASAAVAQAARAARPGGLGRGLAGSPGGVAARLARLSERSSLATHLTVAGLAAVLSLAALGPVAGLAAAVAAGGASATRERRRAAREQRRCERGTPGLARSLADALRGGASVRGALALASVDRAVAPALRVAVTQASGAVALGTPPEQALRALAARGGPGLRLLCGTVALHLEAGGALARELQRLARDGDAARRIDEDRVAATAQARATVRVVGALPVLALLAAEAASGHFLATIAGNPLALTLLLTGFVLEGLAFLAARAIVGPAQ